MRHLTIRNVPPDLGRALDREKRRRASSLNRTVLDLLCERLGLRGARRGGNGLARLAGTWSDEDLARFEAALAPTEQIDEELWR